MDKMNEDKNGDPNENQNQAKADALFLTPRKTDLSRNNLNCTKQDERNRRQTKQKKR